MKFLVVSIIGRIIGKERFYFDPVLIKIRCYILQKNHLLVFIYLISAIPRQTRNRKQLYSQRIFVVSDGAIWKG